MPSEKFLERNPTYRQRQPHPTAKRGPEKIHGFGGLNQFYALQEKGLPAFEDPRRPTVSASEMARRASNQMLMLGPGGTQVADSTANRLNPRRFDNGPQQSPSRVSQMNPHLRGTQTTTDQYGNRLAKGELNTPVSSGRNERGFTPDQQRWADTAATKSATTAAAQGALRGATNPLMAKTPMAPSASNPYSGTREQNVANARASGEFGKVRDEYNSANSARGYSMDVRGDIVEDPKKQAAFNRSQLQPMADNIAANRDFARGEAPLQRTGSFSPDANAQGGMRQTGGFAQKMNPYGTASATYGSTTPAGTGGMMPNPGMAGGQMPVGQWNQEQRAVQDTKMTPATAAKGPVATGGSALDLAKEAGIALKDIDPALAKFDIEQNGGGGGAESIKRTPQKRKAA